MNLYWLYDLPTWLFAFLVIGFFTAFGLTGLWLTRGWVRRIHKVDHSHNDIVSYFLAALTVFYGITLGLVAVGTWETFSTVSGRVDAEAQIVASLYRDAGAYPEPLKTELKKDLSDYVDNVIDVSWPLQSRGDVPYQSGVLLGVFQDHLMTFQPSTPSAQIVHAEVFKQLNQLIEARRARVNAVHSELPMPIWALVVIGGMVCMTTTWFFHTASYQMHVWMTLQMSVLLGLIVFMIAILDNPFRGSVSVSDEPFQLVRSQLMRAQPASPQAAASTSTPRRRAAGS